MQKIFIAIAVQITVLGFVLLRALPIEVLFLTLSIGIAYSLYVFNRKKTKALLIGHLLFLVLFLAWMYVPPYLFSQYKFRRKIF